MNAAPRPPDGFVPSIVCDGGVDARGWERLRRSAPHSMNEEGHECSLEILIVENDAQVATMLKDMIEMKGRYRVTDIASDIAGTLAAIEVRRPDLALIDIHLDGNATGIEVAAKARDRGVPIIFTTGCPLPFPVPELALGCLCKPYSYYSVTQSLRIAQQILCGISNPYGIPDELELY